MKKIFFLLFVLLPFTRSGACPIQHYTMLWLTEHSSVILTGKIVSTREVQEVWDKEKFTVTVATIQVEQLVKGSLKNTKIEYYMGSNFHEFEPKKGSTHLFFLKDPAGGEYYGKYFSAASREGVKTLTPQDLQWNVHQVKELMPILAEQDSLKRERQLQEWLVNCAEVESTRFDAIDDLSRWDYDETQKVYTLHYTLTDDQIMRLTKILVSETASEFFSYSLLDIVVAQAPRTAELRSWALAKLMQPASSNNYLADSYMMLIADTPEMNNMILSFGDANKKPDKQRILNDFIALAQKNKN